MNTFPTPNPQTDPDRREIWDILMREDFEGYCAADFSRCKLRFDPDFCAYDGAGSPNPDDWRVRFPQLAPYEKMWVESARAMRQKQPRAESWLEFFARSVRLDDIEIQDGRAVAHKKFQGTTTLTDGTEFRISWQTLYLLRRRADGWKITGFFGFLPYTVQPDARLADLRIRIARLPRMKHGFYPTPLHRCARLSERLGVDFWIKREDQTGLAFGGNKVRQFELLLGEAAAGGADTIVVGGATQSNYSRQLAAACAAAGLECHCVLSEAHYPTRETGNLLVMQLTGARIHFTPAPLGPRLEAEKRRVFQELKSAGRRPYLVAYPACETLGTIAYVDCGLELYEQCQREQFDPTHLYACAECSTQAGMLFAKQQLAWAVKVTGIHVIRWEFQARPLIAEHIRQAAARLGVTCDVPESEIENLPDFIGEAYGIPTTAAVHAMQVMAETEGIILDPLYTGRAFAAVLDHVGNGRIPQGARLLFIHTGGMPAMFAFTEELQSAR